MMECRKSFAIPKAMPAKMRGRVPADHFLVFLAVVPQRLSHGPCPLCRARSEGFMQLLGCTAKNKVHFGADNPLCGNNEE
jgi:hypothetical protein